MTHLHPLIFDLGILLLTGGLVALLFGFLRQPLIVGYLLAGFLLGPNVSIFPNLTEADGIRLWGEIGVLFLLFSLGLEFSFKKLLRLGPSALVATTVELGTLFGLAWLLIRSFGWSATESTFVAAMVSLSSTAILVRAIEESGTKSARYAGHVFGILIVEDLYSILILVVLATLSSKGGGAGFSETKALLHTIFRFAFFLTIVFVVGMTFLPGLIRATQRFISDEMRLILSLGLCFMTVVLAAKVGFSPVLGAFLMGSLLAGTREAKRIEEILLPVRHLFAAIFFISVGLQINPGVLVDYPGRILLLLLVVLIGKPIAVTLGLVLSGKPLRVSIRSGIAMAQIGEFSFVIASLGISLGLLPREIGSIIVMVATVTALTTPYAVRHSKKIALRIEEWIPKRLRDAIERYETAIQRSRGEEDSRSFIRSQLMVLLVNSTVIGAIGLFFEKAAYEFLVRQLGDRFSIPLVGFGLAAVASAPFFWGIARAGLKDPEVRKFWNNEQRPVLVFILIFRGMVFVAMGVYLASRFFHVRLAYTLAAAVSSIGLLLFSKRVERIYERFAGRFMMSLAEDTHSEEIGMAGTGGFRPAPLLAPWDGHIAVFEVSVDSVAAGRTLIELQIREHYGVTVTLIERGDRKIPAPSANERVFPKDRIHAIGTDDQLAKFREFIEVAPAYSLEEEESYSLEPVTIEAGSPFTGKTIRECGIRERARGLVVGVEREGKRILNPAASFQIATGDLLWIVGETRKVRALQNLENEAGEDA